ncbi:MAG: PrsW family intramembrane metalloprotease [Oscillospiraceae bacterium]|nr:PrsW family intramembrane metalloprotease [Oscillospiraceae bacterium]
MKLLFLLAVAPGAVLLWYICKKDTIEKEPPTLLAKLFGFGGLTIVSAALIELALCYVAGAVLGDGVLYTVVENFLIIAITEEAGKYLVMKKLTWNHPAFNYTFDAVVYAVVASLGFATFENILYVLMNGVGTAILRAVLSVPGHAIFGVFMGCHYGLARSAHEWGDSRTENRELFRAMLVPVLLHGFYDFCLTMDSGVFLVIYFVFEIIVTITAFKTVKRLSNEDRML